MSLSDNAPVPRTTFVRLAKENMPVLPSMGETSSTVARRRIRRTLNVVTTLLSAAGVKLLDQLDDLMNVGVVDSAGASGGIVGGVVETLRGGHQALDRGQDTLEYVLGICGYVTTLAGMSLTAISAARHDTPYPSPPIPRV
ncbi:MAG: hypothetical protein ACJAVV_003144 [Alphaproteobacteria bacterium]|jgi:hypothetical protein